MCLPATTPSVPFRKLGGSIRDVGEKKVDKNALPATRPCAKHVLPQLKQPEANAVVASKPYAGPVQDAAASPVWRISVLSRRPTSGSRTPDARAAGHQTPPSHAVGALAGLFVDVLEAAVTFREALDHSSAPHFHYLDQIAGPE